MADQFFNRVGAVCGLPAVHPPVSHQATFRSSSRTRWRRSVRQTAWRQTGTVAPVHINASLASLRWVQVFRCTILIPQSPATGSSGGLFWHGSENRWRQTVSEQTQVGRYAAAQMAISRRHQLAGCFHPPPRAERRRDRSNRFAQCGPRSRRAHGADLERPICRICNP